MEAESRKELKEFLKERKEEELREKISKMKPINTFFKPRRTEEISLPNGWKIDPDQDYSSVNNGQKVTPKRKASTNLSWGESPGKKQRSSVNFKKNLSFWKNIEGGKTHTQAGPTFSAVRKFQLSLGQERQVAVVSQRDSPGGNYGSGKQGTQPRGGNL